MKRSYDIILSVINMTVLLYRLPLVSTMQCRPALYRAMLRRARLCDTAVYVVCLSDRLSVCPCALLRKKSFYGVHQKIWMKMDTYYQRQNVDQWF